MYPAQENRSTTSSSNPFERKIIGMMGSIARIAIKDHVMILKEWLRFKNGMILIPTTPWIVMRMIVEKIKKRFIYLYIYYLKRIENLAPLG